MSKRDQSTWNQHFSLRSRLPQLIFKWSQDGSNHPRFDEKELLNLRVPDIIREHEDEIAKQVQSAIASRREARELLERAKRTVEIAIEDSETAALAHLNGESCTPGKAGGLFCEPLKAVDLNLEPPEGG